MDLPFPSSYRGGQLVVEYNTVCFRSQEDFGPIATAGAVIFKPSPEQKSQEASPTVVTGPMKEMEASWSVSPKLIQDVFGGLLIVCGELQP
jgi:hypothetical protein